MDNYTLWVPSSFPDLNSDSGQRYSDPDRSPVRWVVWSLGPRPRSPKSQSPRAPMSGKTWYQRTGDAGVIVRFATREGMQVKSP